MRGYTVLTRSEDAGVDMFIKQIQRSLFVFIQTHPEYDVGTLLREYRRDVARFHTGKRSLYPKLPRNYFGPDVAAELEAICRDSVNIAKGFALLDEADLPDGWVPIAVQLYRNWLFYLMQNAQTPVPATP